MTERNNQIHSWMDNLDNAQPSVQPEPPYWPPATEEWMFGLTDPAEINRIDQNLGTAELQGGEHHQSGWRTPPRPPQLPASQLAPNAASERLNIRPVQRPSSRDSSTLQHVPTLMNINFRSSHGSIFQSENVNNGMNFTSTPLQRRHALPRRGSRRTSYPSSPPGWDERDGFERVPSTPPPAWQHVVPPPIEQKRHRKPVLRKAVEGDCSICWDAFEPNQDLLHCKTTCGTNFHKTCFVEWLKTPGNRDNPKAFRCPFCRGPWDDEELKQLQLEHDIPPPRGMKRSRGPRLSSWTFEDPGRAERMRRARRSRLTVSPRDSTMFDASDLQTLGLQPPDFSVPLATRDSVFLPGLMPTRSQQQSQSNNATHQNGMASTNPMSLSNITYAGHPSVTYQSQMGGLRPLSVSQNQPLGSTSSQSHYQQHQQQQRYFRTMTSSQPSIQPTSPPFASSLRPLYNDQGHMPYPGSSVQPQFAPGLCPTQSQQYQSSGSSNMQVQFQPSVQQRQQNMQSQVQQQQQQQPQQQPQQQQQQQPQQQQQNQSQNQYQQVQQQQQHPCPAMRNANAIPNPFLSGNNVTSGPQLAFNPHGPIFSQSSYEYYHLHFSGTYTFAAYSHPDPSNIQR